MNDLINQDLSEKIILALLQGENPDTVCNRFSCDLSLVMRIMASRSFSERISEFLTHDIKIGGVVAVAQIKKIAKDDGISKATQLKANQWLAEKALELSVLGADDDSPATMTQDQLKRRLKTLQDEADRRMIKIDGAPLENMME